MGTEGRWESTPQALPCIHLSQWGDPHWGCMLCPLPTASPTLPGSRALAQGRSCLYRTNGIHQNKRHWACFYSFPIPSFEAQLYTAMAIERKGTHRGRDADASAQSTAQECSPGALRTLSAQAGAQSPHSPLLSPHPGLRALPSMLPTGEPPRAAAEVSPWRSRPRVGAAGCASMRSDHPPMSPHDERYAEGRFPAMQTPRAAGCAPEKGLSWPCIQQDEKGFGRHPGRSPCKLNQRHLSDREEISLFPLSFFPFDLLKTSF